MLDLDRFNAFCKNRPVLRSHVLSDDIPSLDLMDLFQFQQWEPLVTCTHIAYPQAVKMFYFTANFSIGETKSVEAIVQGRGVNLTASQINRFLGVPDDGDRYFLNNLWDIRNLIIIPFLLIFLDPISLVVPHISKLFKCELSINSLAIPSYLVEATLMKLIGCIITSSICSSTKEKSILAISCSTT